MESEGTELRVIDRTPVESSQIKTVGYDPESGEMDIQFKPGSVYRYRNVEQKLFDDFMAAESKGKFFGQFIKPRQDEFLFSKIRGTDKEEAKKAEEAQDAARSSEESAPINEAGH